ncbi:MAG: hypothetical protein GX046_01790 [Tissierellia bacterium]|nr:hypothetical protein [Tissierellia bacterium]
MKQKKKSLGFILTEHMDYHDYKKGTVFDPSLYFEKLEKYRSPELGLGIELGLRHEAKAYYEEILRKYPFDYALGSLHAPYRS